MSELLIYDPLFTQLKVDPELQAATVKLKNGEILEDFDHKILLQQQSLFFRWVFLDNVGHFLPTRKFAMQMKTDIIKEGKVLEVMAGDGVLAGHLKDAGVDIIATDIFVHEPIFPVEELDAIKAVEKYGPEIDFLLMCWSPPSDPIVHQTAIRLHEVNPEALILFMGEISACNGTVEYFDGVEEVEEISTEAVNSIYPQWYAFHDRLHVHRWVGD